MSTQSRSRILGWVGAASATQTPARWNTTLRLARVRSAPVGFALALGIAAASLACEGPPGPDGASGEAGGMGEAGASGEQGPPGIQGTGADAIVPRQPVVTGPGLTLTVTSASIDASGVASVAFTVMDGHGTPLDYTGAYTTGPVGANFVLSALSQTGDAGPPGYAALTQRAHTSADGKTTTMMPDSDTGGTLTEVGQGNGTYTYAFGTKVPNTDDATQTHTVGIWATRVFGGQTYVVNALYDFVPSGAAVTKTRDIITTAACNQCHNPLGYHEGNTQRRETGLCVLCHGANVVDVSNSDIPLELGPMVHRIHRGRFLASVDAGVPYVLTEEATNIDAGADGGAVAPVLVDHSTAWFPGALQNCKMCHQGPQGDVWETTASRAACGGCHDATAYSYPPPFPWMKLHGGGAVKDDTTCLNSSCHSAADQYGIAKVHNTPSTDTSAPQLGLTITSVTNTNAGETPVLHFSVTTNGAAIDLKTRPLPWLAVTLAGPTTDYAQSTPITYAIQGAGAVGTLTPEATLGSYAYAFPAPLEATATGSYAVGMEGYLEPNPLSGVVYAALNPVWYFGVTDLVAVPRRTVVERAKCNSCHYDLSAHNGTRKSPEYCVLCHTPGAYDADGVPRLEVPTTTAPSLQFKVLVHKIHRGNKLKRGYVLGGQPLPTPTAPAGTPIDFGKVDYPGDQRACWACHASTSYLPPLADGLLPTVTAATLSCSDPSPSPAAYCVNRTLTSTTTLAPVAAACTACHDDSSTVAHVEVNVAPDGAEACATCHGAGAQWDTQLVHALPP
ncbi:MAG: OmcA/MtrC family decaheme c-type cytochrome [Polyangiales bacterium]